MSPTPPTCILLLQCSFEKRATRGLLRDQVTKCMTGDIIMFRMWSHPCHLPDSPSPRTPASWGPRLAPSQPTAGPAKTWVQLQDPESNKLYYHNHLKNQSVWSLAPDDGVVVPSLDPYDNPLTMPLLEFIEHPLVRNTIHNGATLQARGILEFHHVLFAVCPHCVLSVCAILSLHRLCSFLVLQTTPIWKQLVNCAPAYRACPM